MKLVSLSQAKQHLRVDFDDEDELISLLIEASSEAVCNYLKDAAYSFLQSDGDVEYDNAEIPLNIPNVVKVATLYLTSFLYKNRDEDDKKAFEPGFLPAPVTALLYPLRKPALA